MSGAEISLLLAASLCMAWALFAACLLRIWLRQIVDDLVRLGETLEALATRVSALEHGQQELAEEGGARRDERRVALLRSLLDHHETLRSAPRGGSAPWPA